MSAPPLSWPEQLMCVALPACCSLSQAGGRSGLIQNNFVWCIYWQPDIEKALLYPASPRWSPCVHPPGAGFPQSEEAVTSPASLISALVHGVAPLTTLGPFGCTSVITILGLVPFTSSPSPYKRGRGEQEPCTQGGTSEDLHICAASQNTVPPPSPLLIVSLPMAFPGDSGEQGEELLSWRQLWCYTPGQRKSLCTGFRMRFGLPAAVGHRW